MFSASTSRWFSLISSSGFWYGMAIHLYQTFKNVCVYYHTMKPDLQRIYISFHIPYKFLTNRIGHPKADLRSSHPWVNIEFTGDRQLTIILIIIDIYCIVLGMLKARFWKWRIKQILLTQQRRANVSMRKNDHNLTCLDGIVRSGWFRRKARLSRSWGTFWQMRIV